jgi:Leucine-rich repeat (LRR) protein
MKVASGEEKVVATRKRKTSLSAALQEASQTHTLDLSGRKLIDLPLEIGQLTDLRELNLQNNQLAGLPSEIGQLTDLRELNLQNN